MGSGLEQFVKDVLEDTTIRAGGNASRERLEESYTSWVLEQLAEHGEIDDGEAVTFSAPSQGPWPAAKLNAWSLSGDEATLDLFVTLHLAAEGIRQVGLPDTRRHFKLLLGFLRRCREGFHKRLEEQQDAFEVARRISGAKDTLTTVRLFFLTDGVARAEDIEQEQLDGLELRYVLWDIKKLSQLRVGQRQVIELDFSTDFGGPLPCLACQQPADDYTTYLAFLPGTVLAKMYGEYGQRLLERNVRAFLQTKGKVNRGIQETLRTEPERFLAYNNGLCCTAAHVELGKSVGGQLGLARVRDFQIVNGGQTTASIYHALKKERLDIDDVVVQVKLTVLPDEERLGEIVPLIARYANSQNKVNAADLSANGVFHQRLENMSRLEWAPAVSGLARHTHWYYERARGSYLDDKARQRTPGKQREWTDQNPPHQKFTKTDLAKVEHAWLGLPHLVCLGAEKNFVRFAERLDADGEPEVNRDYFRHAVAKAILWKTCEKLFDSLDLRGYRSNSVAYAMAWLAEKAGRRIDLNHIWARQHVSPATCTALKVVCKAAWEHLNQQQGNVNEASKKSECWEVFRGRDIALAPEWLSELVDVPFITPGADEDKLPEIWEKLRRGYFADLRTMGDLEAATGMKWVRRRKKDYVSTYAVLAWPELRGLPGVGLKKVRSLIQMLAVDAQS